MRYLMAVALAVSVTAPAAGQHVAGAREQWQPQRTEERADPDLRLARSVEIEIVGRAMGPALEMLSEATGVSLGVAPEDLDTLGERKITLISKGLTLKAVMVQIPWALHECHWDVDPGSEERAYLLHRAAGAAYAVEQEDQQRRAAIEAERRAAIAGRIEDAERALAMSAAEIASLEETDLVLARAARDPTARALMEAFLSLPEEVIAELQANGHAQLEYAGAPRELGEMLRLALELERRRLEWIQSWPPEVERATWHDEAGLAAALTELENKLESEAEIEVWLDYSGLISPGIRLRFEGAYCPVVPMREPRAGGPGNWCQFLLAQTGDDREEALETAERLRHEWFRLRDKRQWDESAWVEPSDPRLHQQVALPLAGPEGEQYTELSELQRVVAARTGMSVISDYFTAEGIGTDPGQRPLGGALWRDLYVLGQAGGFEWKHVDECLVFRRTNWPRLVQRELPESLIDEYRARLREQGSFTLEDILDLAAALDARRAASSRGDFSLPADLIEAGARAPARAHGRRMLLLYRALSPEERAAARRPGGLAFAEMSAQRRAALEGLALSPGMRRGRLSMPLADYLGGMVFSTEDTTGEEDGRPFTQHDFRLKFPDKSQEEAHLSIRLVELPVSGEEVDAAEPDG